MTYKEAIEYIHSTLKFGSKLGLDNIRYLLNLLGNPHEKLKIIHIAGTNGKGSTSAMIANTLQGHGYKTGLYTSPYVEVFNERIRINDEYISDEDIAQLTSELKTHIKTMIDNGRNHPTEFEIITAMAFAYFERQKCDFVVLEVGMGGRLDATNAVENPLLSVITAIDFDHTEYLGDTILKIAFEKCGIIKKNSCVVTYSNQLPDAFDIIKKTCAEKNSKLIVANEPENIVSTLHGNTFDIKGHTYKTNLIGMYQAYNASTAITALNMLNEYGYTNLSQRDIENGIMSTRWKGRFEIVRSNPLTILDGGHNLNGVTALVQSLKKIINNEKLIIVVGMLKDKQYPECIEKLSEIAEEFICTDVPSPRYESAYELQKHAAKYCNKVTVEPDCRKAVDVALEKAKGQGRMLCITGSLYLIGDIYGYINKNK